MFTPCYRGRPCVFTAFGYFNSDPGALHLHADLKDWIAPESEPEPFIDDDFCNDWAVIVSSFDRDMQCPPKSGFVTMINLSLEAFTFDPFDRDKVHHAAVCLQRVHFGNTLHNYCSMQELNITLIVRVTAGEHTVFHVSGNVYIAPEADQVIPWLLLYLVMTLFTLPDANIASLHMCNHLIQGLVF